MAQFTYLVKNADGKQQKGKISAMDKTTAMEELKKRGLVVLSLKEYKQSALNTEIYIGNPVKNEHFIVYCRQFATLIRSGVTIVDATRILAMQTESKPLSKALTEVTSSLLRGVSFSAAIQEHKKIFPELFINMMRAGEETGDLEGTLERLAVYFEKAHYTREKVKSAMTYPMVVGVLAVLVVIYLLRTVVPQFATMFTQMGAELPVITKIVMSVSNSMGEQWYFWVLGLILLIVAFMIFRKTDRGRYIIDLWKLKVPVFGKLNQKGAIAQMTRTLASLYASSVPVLESLKIVQDVVGNKVIGGFIAESRDSLQKGNALSEPLKKAWVFPPLVTQMISIGEETGSLDEMLNKIADFYERDVENTVDRLKSLIEPLLIVFLAVVVGFIVMAIMLPMFALYGEIG